MNNSYPIPETKEPMYNIEKIQAYFKRDLPKEIKLDEVTTIRDVRRFVDAHISLLRGKEHKPVYKPYYERLQLLAKLL